ncbi:hypothetical protein A9513_005115 [Pseudomonas sp. AU12215]|nr:hypothetical protein A9513_005115 [Pseudomonas sp. AU12215]
MSLAAFVSRRYFLAACLWLLAAVVHPLQALAVALVLWCWLCVDDRRWVWLAVPAVIVTALAYLIRGPSLFFFQQYDAQWLAWISGPNRNVFLKNWPVASWVSLGLDFLLVLLARHFVLGRVREFYTALLIALIVGFVASLVLVDWLSLVLPTGLQLWRVQWISHWGAMAAIPLVMWQVLQQAYGRERSLFLFATIIWAVPVGPMAPSPLLSLFPLALFFFWPSIAPKIRERFRIAMLAGLVIALIIGTFKYCLVVYLAFLKQGGSLNNYRLDAIILAYPLISCLVLVLIYLGVHRFGQPARYAALAAIAAFSVYSMISWDSRSTWNTYIERSAGENPFGTPIEQGAQVYWADMLLAPWSVLHRPSYFNEGQQAGLLFNRETARQASIRNSVTQILSFQSEICAVVNSAAGRDDHCAPDIQTVRDMCEAAEGKLSYIVLQNRLSEPPMGLWNIPRSYSGEAPVTYYLYGCAGLDGHAVANAR